MQTLTDYINDYCDISFVDKPFCDGDNVALSYMFYMPLEQVVSSNVDDEPQRYSRVASKLFEQRGYEHKQVGLILLKDISVKMMAMARSKRFAEMQVVACTEVYQKEPAVQFGAGTFLLPNGQIVVVFRGTDDTLTGWQEDFDILFKESIPSHKLATEYLESIANKFDGEIIICGHSKGGYVAQYAALNCSPEIRGRIKRLYNNDGPGFSDYTFMHSDAYKELLPKYRHFVPQSSFIGMLLSHDDDYTVVKSKRVLGPLQHDLSTWLFDGPELKTANELTTTGKFNDMLMRDVVSKMTKDEQKAFDEVLTSYVTQTNNEGLIDYRNKMTENFKSDINLIEKFDKKTVEKANSVFMSILPSIRDVSKTVLHSEIDEIKEKLSNR